MRLFRVFGAGSLLRRTVDNLVPSVARLPPELEACESECRETDCCGSRWETCERRLRHLAARQAWDERERQRADAA